MSTSDGPSSKPSTRARLPRWTYPIFLIGGTIAVHVALPWAISLITTRHGWVDSRPGVWNLIGLIPVAAGLAMIAWAGSRHFTGSTGAWELVRTPRYILIKGPYRFSRNPMYLLELAMWLGWAIFYGSIAVLIACVGWWIVFAFFAIPYEEGQLAARFGDTYLQYKKSIPRWLGPVRQS